MNRERGGYFGRLCLHICYILLIPCKLFCQDMRCENVGNRSEKLAGSNMEEKLNQTLPQNVYSHYHDISISFDACGE